LSRLVDLILEELDEDALERLATRLRPHLRGERDGWLDAKQAAEYAGTTVPAVHTAVSRGTLTPSSQSKPGGRLYFTREALDEWRGL